MLSDFLVHLLFPTPHLHKAGGYIPSPASPERCKKLNHRPHAVGVAVVAVIKRRNALRVSSWFKAMFKGFSGINSPLNLRRCEPEPCGNVRGGAKRADVMETEEFGAYRNGVCAVSESE